MNIKIFSDIYFRFTAFVRNYKQTLADHLAGPVPQQPTRWRSETQYRFFMLTCRALKVCVSSQLEELSSSMYPLNMK